MSVDPHRAFSTLNLAKLFNEWMRIFTEEPERFQAEFKTVGQFLKEEAAGKEPSYGAHCAAYLCKLEDDLKAPGKIAPPRRKR